MADPVEALLEGKVQTVEFSGGNVVVDAPRAGRVYMAGSFNPLHDGHRGMLAAVLKLRQDKQGWVPVNSCVRVPLFTTAKYSIKTWACGLHWVPLSFQLL